MSKYLRIRRYVDPLLRQFVMRSVGCTPSTLLGTLAIFLVACSTAVAQDLGTPATISMNGDMSLFQALNLVIKFGWPAVATYLGHRLLKLFENGAKATEAGRPMLRLVVVHQHLVDDSRERAHRRSSDCDVHAHRRRDSDDDRPRHEDTEDEITWPDIGDHRDT